MFPFLEKIIKKRMEDVCKAKHDFKEIFGVNPEQFDFMWEVCGYKSAEEHVREIVKKRKLTKFVP